MKNNSYKHLETTGSPLGENRRGCFLCLPRVSDNHLYLIFPGLTGTCLRQPDHWSSDWNAGFEVTDSLLPPWHPSWRDDSSWTSFTGSVSLMKQTKFYLYCVLEILNNSRMWKKCLKILIWPAYAQIYRRTYIWRQFQSNSRQLIILFLFLFQYFFLVHILIS